MKRIIIFSMAIMLHLYTAAQSNQQIPLIYLNKDVSTHFVSKLNIDYTDLSTNDVVGDLPMKNILRIKPKTESDNLGFVTIVGESFFLQFKLEYTKDLNRANKHIDLDDPAQFRVSSNVKNTAPGTAKNHYDNPNYSLDHEELKKYALELYKEKPTLNNVVSKAYKMKLKLNNVWVVDDYIFFDYTAQNKANIPYTIDEIRYKIIDTKQVKATNSQDQLLVPDYQSNKTEFFKDEFRNIVAFKKFTFPNDKSFIIEITEEQISGRKITLEMFYSDILEAKTFNSNTKNSK